MNSFFYLRIFISVICVISTFVNAVYGQQETETLINIEQKLEQNAGEGEESPDLSELTAITSELLEHPLNLNRAGVDELRLSGLFSDAQIEALLLHRETFGNLLAVQEMQKSSLLLLQLPAVVVEAIISGRAEPFFFTLLVEGMMIR